MSLAPILVLLAACSSCAGWVAQRSPAEQHNAMVKIKTTCPTGVVGFGTGVLVSEDRVLTAAHVIQCDIARGLGLYQEPLTVEVFASDVEFTTASVEIVLAGSDVARLQLKKAMPAFFTPIRVGAPPVIGDKVCEASAVPRMTYRCGVAQYSLTGYIYVDMMVEHGQSGSGMYNEAGELVGIITNLRRCQDGVSCAGWGTALTGYAWLVP